jgi:hypothetical protein
VSVTAISRPPYFARDGFVHSGPPYGTIKKRRELTFLFVLCVRACQELHETRLPLLHTKKELSPYKPLLCFRVNGAIPACGQAGERPLQPQGLSVSPAAFRATPAGHYFVERRRSKVSSAGVRKFRAPALESLERQRSNISSAGARRNNARRESLEKQQGRQIIRCLRWFCAFRATIGRH